MTAFYRDIQTGHTILAERLSSENVHELVAWCDGEAVKELNTLDHTSFVGINVPTKLGRKRASEGDYICRDVNLGFFFVQKPGSFGASYEIT